MSRLPGSLFARTSLLIAATLFLFALIAWQAIIWTAMAPAADAAASLLTLKAEEALEARGSGHALPEGVRFDAHPPDSGPPRPASLAVRTYVGRVRSQLEANFPASDVQIRRYIASSEIWMRTPRAPDAWLVLTWRIAGPGAPMATLVIWGAAAALALGAAAISARRLTLPLAGLAEAAQRVANGERIDVAAATGPSEVRALAAAFQTMAQRLGELDQQRELMLSGISHDLRTPLARLRVALELLNDADPALLEEMSANIEEMDRMIGQFLQYARTGYRETPVHASLDDIARETLATYATDTRVTLDLRAPERRRFAVEGVRHVLLNLVQNALDHGQPPVTVRCSSSEEGIRLDVCDRGSGLTAAEWAEALQPFCRLRGRPGGAHAGLGLAMVERLVRVSGGTLEAQQVDGGFAITVRLPAPA